VCYLYPKEQVRGSPSDQSRFLILLIQGETEEEKEGKEFECVVCVLCVCCVCVV